MMSQRRDHQKNQLKDKKSSSYRTNVIDFSHGTYEGNLLGVILGKELGFTIIATDGLPLGWSLGHY